MLLKNRFILETMSKEELLEYIFKFEEEYWSRLDADIKWVERDLVNLTLAIENAISDERAEDIRLDKSRLERNMEKLKIGELP